MDDGRTDSTTPQTEAPSTKKQALRGRDEVDFLDSRAFSVPLRPTLAREKLRTLGRITVQNEGSAGQMAHDEGELLIEAYVRHLDAALDIPSFRKLLEEHYPRTPANALLNMRIAKAFTREEAGRWGATKCDLALQLIDALGLIPEGIEERTAAQRTALEVLRKTTLRLPERLGGGTTRFPAKVRELRGALWLLHNPQADDETPPTVGTELVRTRALLAKAGAEDADVAALKARAYIEDGEVVTRVDARGRAGAAAAERMYARLKRAR